MGVKWSPRYVRVATQLPVTETSKILKRQLRAERWESADPIWWRPARGASLVRLGADDVAAIRDAFVAGGRANQLDAC